MSTFKHKDVLFSSKVAGGGQTTLIKLRLINDNGVEEAYVAWPNREFACTYQQSVYAETDSAIGERANSTLRPSRRRHRVAVAEWRSLTDTRRQHVRNFDFSISQPVVGTTLSTFTDSPLCLLWLPRGLVCSLWCFAVFSKVCRSSGYKQGAGTDCVSLTSQNIFFKFWPQNNGMPGTRPYSPCYSPCVASPLHQPENPPERPRARRISPWRSSSLFPLFCPTIA